MILTLIQTPVSYCDREVTVFPQLSHAERILLPLMAELVMMLCGMCRNSLGVELHRSRDLLKKESPADFSCQSG